MLHLRIITPAERTEETVTTLRGVPGTYNLIVLPGAAREPEGDVILCDVARESGDDAVHALRRLGVDAYGSIAVENVDLTVSQGADRAEKEAPGTARTPCCGTSSPRSPTRSRRSPSPTSPS